MAEFQAERMAAEPDEPRSDRFPSAYTILFTLIVLGAALSWIVLLGRCYRG